MENNSICDAVKYFRPKNSAGILEARLWMGITVSIIGAMVYGILTS